MAADGVLSAAERQVAIDRRLDEIDRALLGLLPRAERLAVMANVEARVMALGEDVQVAAIARNVDAAVEFPSGVLSQSGRRSGTRRSRLAFTAGVLGIISVACLVLSPILFIGLTMVAELLDETAAIALMGLFTLLLLLAGGYAFCGGGVSLFRLAGREQTKTGTGWAITGLCTGALPMLIGVVCLLALGGHVVQSEAVAVTWSAPPGGPVEGQIYAQPVGYPTTGMPSPNMPDHLPSLLPPDARTASQPQLKAPAKPGPAVEPESAPLLPAAPPADTDDEIGTDD